jgi:hypothetical protein
LGERLLCKQEVIGSIPFTSTNEFALREFISGDFIDKRRRLSMNSLQENSSAVAL